jgi:two-component sensor histidine kinase
MNQLLRAADAWRKGDYGVRSGLDSRSGEFGALGEAFDGAAAEVERRERELREGEKRQQLLIAELNHRVKNTLATVQSLAAQSLRSAPDPAAFRQNFEARLLALSKTHDLLTRSFWESADLRDILEGELSPHARDDFIRCRLDGPSVHLIPKQALALGMVAHELATNAAKHGALSRLSGQVTVQWSVEGDGRMLQLEWRERGGPPTRPPARNGFGTRLLEATIVRELAGSLEQIFAPEGMTCRIGFRIAEASPEPPDHAKKAVQSPVA